MGSGKADRKQKPRKNPKPNRKPLAPNRQTPTAISKSNKNKNKKKKTTANDTNKTKEKTKTTSLAADENPPPPRASPSQQLSYFLTQFQSANGVQLSSLELESIKDSCILDVSEEVGETENVMGLEKHIKEAFGDNWKQELCEGKLIEGQIEAGNPSLLIIATSALRSIELLRGMRSFTKECPAVKLFAKHMKVDEQVSLLKKRVNIASGTPSRIKKLIDIEALGLSRLSLILLDIHTDVKGYSLLTLPQVRDEFWDLYKNYFHPRVFQGDLRICLFGPIPNGNEFKGKSLELADG